MPSIPQDIIEQVRQASDIVEIIGEFVRLKKRGRNYQALCPFHNEKAPSFSVSPDKQMYYCFGCNKGGNVITFLMEHENMTFVDAVRMLAARAGITIPEKRTDDTSKEELERLHYAHQLALDYFKKVLHSDKYKTNIFKYLHDSRKLTDETIDFFQLGLSGLEWDGFFNYALKKGLFPPELMKAGLISHSDKNDKYFDRFRQRLMIPIFNLSDKPIAFGARALSKGETAKYINSPETKLYYKSNVLYGLNFTRRFIREQNAVIIVEGYFDLISLYQAGIKNVVASSGTAFTAQQARLLARFADMAYLFFDADSAGEQAAVRSVDTLYDAGMEVLVMVPPSGYDPDKVAIEQGAEGIDKIKENARGYLEFRTRELDIKKEGIIGKEKLIKELAELAGKIQDITRRQLFVTEAAERLQTDVQNFYNLLPRQQTASKPKSEIKPPKKIADMERDLLSLLLNHPEHFDLIPDKIAADDFQSNDLRKIFSLILAAYNANGDISVNSLIDLAENSELVSELTALAGTEWPDEDVRLMIKDYISKLMGYKRERVIDRLKGELKLAEEKGDSDSSRRLTLEITELIKHRQDQP
jgi:DNA primase